MGTLGTLRIPNDFCCFSFSLPWLRTEKTAKANHAGKVRLPREGTVKKNNNKVGCLFMGDAIRSIGRCRWYRGRVIRMSLCWQNIHIPECQIDTTLLGTNISALLKMIFLFRGGIWIRSLKGTHTWNCIEDAVLIGVWSFFWRADIQRFQVNIALGECIYHLFLEPESALDVSWLQFLTFPNKPQRFPGDPWTPFSSHNDYWYISGFPNLLRLRNWLTSKSSNITMWSSKEQKPKKVIPIVVLFGRKEMISWQETPWLQSYFEFSVQQLTSFTQMLHAKFPWLNI